MADDVARAVGAAGAETITIGGKTCTVRPLTIRELAEVERECVKIYVRAHLETYSRNLDLLPCDEDSKMKLLSSKLEAASRWDVGDLPQRYAYDPGTIFLSGLLKEWIKQELQFVETDASGKPLSEQELNDRYRKAAVTALDAGLLKEEHYHQLTGRNVGKVPVGYVNWWITGSMEGMLTMVWACFKSYGVSREEVAEAIGNNFNVLANLSRDIEHLSVPAVGNG